MKVLLSVFILSAGILSYADVPSPIHLTCTGADFALGADALANVINSNRLTNIRGTLGSSTFFFAQRDGLLEQGHIWHYVYNLNGIELHVQANFAQTLKKPLMAYLHFPSNNQFEPVACQVTAAL